ncbi:hypothetical protein TrCOL_g9113, partial [Triparma columacea]
MHGDHPREIWNNINGSRSQQLFYVNKISSTQTRFFDEWRTWKKIDSSKENDKQWESKYILAFGPMSMYDGTKNRVKDKNRLTLGGASRGTHVGCYFIHSVSPNVCSVLKVVKVNLAYYAKVPLHVLLKSYTALLRTDQKKFQRNATTVDRELRTAIVDTLHNANGTNLSSEQQIIFKSFEDLEKSLHFKRRKFSEYSHDFDGIDVHESEEDVFKNGLPGTKVQFTVDCSASEAAAWYFDPITNKGLQRNTFKIFERLAKFGGAQPANERIFMVVKTKPWYNPREFIDKRIWKVEDDGSIKIVVWPAKNISFSPKHGKDKSVRCSTKALFHASNIVNPNSSLRQCTVTLTQLIEGHSPSFGSAAAATDELLRTIGHLCEDLRQDAMVDKAHLADFKDMLESDAANKYT